MGSQEGEGVSICRMVGGNVITGGAGVPEGGYFRRLR